MLYIAASGKENEIRSMIDLSTEILLRNRTICVDAMYTQRPVSAEILAKESGYIWIAKKDQLRLQQFFAPTHQRLNNCWAGLDAIEALKMGFTIDMTRLLSKMRPASHPVTRL